MTICRKPAYKTWVYPVSKTKYLCIKTMKKLFMFPSKLASKKNVVAFASVIAHSDSKISGKSIQKWYTVYVQFCTINDEFCTGPKRRF